MATIAGQGVHVQLLPFVSIRAAWWSRSSLWLKYLWLLSSSSQPSHAGGVWTRCDDSNTSTSKGRKHIMKLSGLISCLAVGVLAPGFAVAAQSIIASNPAPARLSEDRKPNSGDVS